MNDDEAKETQAGEEKFSSDLYIDDPDHPENQFYTPAEKLAHYHESLGRFVTDFTEAEALLRYMCARATGMPDNMAGLLIGDIGIASGAQLLKRLRDVRGLNPDEDLAEALKQFGDISETRNAILHRGVAFGEQVFTTKPGLPNNRRRQFQVSTLVLEAMSNDLFAIRIALITALPSDDPRLASWGQGIRNPERVQWQYKHAPLPQARERR